MGLPESKALPGSQRHGSWHQGAWLPWITELCGILTLAQNLISLSTWHQAHFVAVPIKRPSKALQIQTQKRHLPLNLAMSSSPSPSMSMVTLSCPSSPLLQTVWSVPHPAAPGTHKAQAEPAPKGDQQLASLSVRLLRGEEASVGRGEGVLRGHLQQDICFPGQEI